MTLAGPYWFFAYAAFLDDFLSVCAKVLMTTLTVRIPDENHERLRILAKGQGVSLNKLVDEIATIALTQHDAEIRFRLRSAKGSAKHGLSMRNKLDAAFKKR